MPRPALSKPLDLETMIPHNGNYRDRASHNVNPDSAYSSLLYNSIAVYFSLEALGRGHNSKWIGKGIL